MSGAATLTVRGAFASATGGSVRGVCPPRSGRGEFARGTNLNNERPLPTLAARVARTTLPVPRRLLGRPVERSVA